ncbi:beta-phosphoglucomutase [Geosporobacter ferrireducens]|uniref:beta-phosphoglucomutase n=1 Tax=Geosporobacter ferrireducens TaxID=1424294 RepID=UPI00139D7191|nr:beta-phosphoglucomutase [Geosporobacter ferrireducens]MTI56983.1 beta-phosphoglucomutase [Geosporobacter ferrireducens]
MIRAVIFDLDGVITETSRQHFQAWKAVAYMIGVEIDSTVNESLKGVSREESLKIILKYGGILDKYSKEEMEKLCFCKNEYYKQLISQFTPANVFEGVVEMFEYLRGKGIKIAIGSASHNAPALISAMALEPYIDYIVDPGDVKRGKPAPDIFLKAAGALGVKPSECIGVEDAVAGVEAIKAAGMYAIGIGDAEVLKEADVVFGSIAEIDLGIIA